MSVLGDNIRKYRKLKNITITDLCKITGVGRTTISEIERGISKSPRAETLKSIAIALDVSLDQLTNMNNDEEYAVTDIEEAMNIILSQNDLMLHGEVITDDDKKQLATSIKMAIAYIEKNREK